MRVVPRFESKYCLPVIERYVKQVIQEGKVLQKRIDDGDIQSLQKIVELRFQAQRNLMLLDKFLKQNHHDQDFIFLYSDRTILAEFAAGYNRNDTISSNEIDVPWKIPRRNHQRSQKSTGSRKSISPLGNSKKSDKSKGSISNSHLKNSKSSLASRDSKSTLKSKQSDKQNSPLQINTKAVRQVHKSKSPIKDKSNMPSFSKPQPQQPIRSLFPLQKQQLYKQPQALQISFNNKQIFQNASCTQRVTYTLKLSKRQFQQILKEKKKFGKQPSTK